MLGFRLSNAAKANGMSSFLHFKILFFFIYIFFLLSIVFVKQVWGSPTKEAPSAFGNLTERNRLRLRSRLSTCGWSGHLGDKLDHQVISNDLTILPFILEWLCQVQVNNPSYDGGLLYSCTCKPTKLYESSPLSQVSGSPPSRSRGQDGIFSL